ncbi:metallophosphoesterase [uncultured Bacteroides sp.]|uniref:metallophosphoesterase n=1 Tax=uncultured Bacteroides sp. TaxID=162156 RepID=UPI002AAC1514|nr:metallophosphoesterase [uncultured Bacteroides sp.]
MRKIFLFLLFVPLFMSCSTGTNRDVTVVVAADLHFDLLPETDQYYHVVTINNLENNFRFPENAGSGIAGQTLKKLNGVILAGDLFDKSRPEILNLYRQRYEQGPGARRIHYPVYPGLGNHDIDPAVSDKGADNLKGRAYTLHYIDSVLETKLSKGEILNLDSSSLCYSWNIDDVHFIQGQRYAGDTTYCQSNFDWLKRDLEKYASHGNPVVYIQHYGFDEWALKWWPEKNREELFDLLDQYNLAAFFVGHTHTASIQHYRGHAIYQVNNAWKDDDGNGSFAVMRIKGNALSISTCRWTDGEGHFEVVAPYENRILP